MKSPAPWKSAYGRNEAQAGLEERKSKLDALRAHLAQGAAQAARSEFVEDYSIEQVISELD